MREGNAIARVPVCIMGVGLLLAILPGRAAMALIGLGTSAAHFAYNKYSEGELERQYNAPMDLTWNATLEALNDLDIRVMEKDRSLEEIDARLYDGDTVKVRLALSWCVGPGRGKGLGVALAKWYTWSKRGEG